MSTLTPKTDGYVNLNYVVAQVRMDMEDGSDRLLEKATQYAINCFTDLNVMSELNVEVDYFTMDANGMVDVSDVDDFVDVVKIGVPVGGKIYVLSKNDKILKDRNALSEAEAGLIFKGEASDQLTSCHYFADHYRDGEYISGLFGLAGGFSRSYFTFDRETRMIQFDSAVPRSEIILEYTSSGLNVTGTTVIPRYLVSYMKAYVRWMLALNDPNFDRYKIKTFYDRFLEEERLLVAYQYRFDVDEYYAMTYSTYTQTPKR